MGGLVLNLFARMPKPNEEIEWNGYVFRVTSADKRRIKQLKLTIPLSHK